MKGFKSRNPTLSFRKPEGITAAAACVTPQNITIWFENLIAYLEEKNVLHHLLERPQNFINLDETGIDLNAPPKKIFTTKNVHHSYLKESAKHHARITMTMSITADGSILPSQIILPSSYSEIVTFAQTAGKTGIDYEISQTTKGWQDKKSYWGYLKAIDRHMEEVRNVERPYIIFADGYPAHHDLDIFKWCREREIIYVLLYPNSTQATQPLDFSCFHSLKSSYRKEAAEYKRTTQKTSVNEIDFIQILSRAIQKGVSPEIIRNGFKSCGLFPLDRSQVHDERLLGSSTPAALPPNVAASNSLDNNSVNPVNAPIILESVALAPNDKLKIIDSLIQEYRNSIPANNAMKAIIIETIQQQMKLLHSLEVAEPCIAVANDIPSTSSMSHFPASDSMMEILKRPQPNERKRKRQLKIDKCGAMSTDAIIAQHEKIEEEKRLAEEVREERKRIRIERKEINETALKIKQENVEKPVRKKQTKRK